MISKAVLFVLGLSTLVVVISTNVQARDLVESSSISRTAEVDKQQNEVGISKYASKACIKGSDGESSDCFLFPGFPGFPSIPGFSTPGFGTPGFGTPRTTDIPKFAGDIKYGSKACIKGSDGESSDCFMFPGFPGFPGLPGFSTPGFGTPGFGTPGTTDIPKFSGDIKYGSKACIKGSGGESSDCFMFPGFPGFPGIPGFGTPGFGTPGSVDIPRYAGDVKYGSKACIQVNGVESSDCFIFPGFGFPGIPQFPSFPGFPSIPLTPKSPITPITPIAPRS